MDLFYLALQTILDLCISKMTQNREQYVSKINYEITVVILWRRFIFPD
jgi:hypothetical protein